jgi:hypothetical protein
MIATDKRYPTGVSENEGGAAWKRRERQPVLIAAA